MDFLEKRILEKRDELDHVERVDEGLLWQNIQADLSPPIAKLKPQRSQIFLQIYAVAASVALLAMASWMIVGTKDTNLKATTSEVVEIEQLPIFKNEAVKEYRQTVAAKEQEVNIESINKQEFEDIFYELEILETMQQEFRKDLPEISDKEKAIKVLQKYYERKIRILERLSKEIEKKSQHERRINESPR
ncbi:MAG: hypothetical protein AAF573_03430 [Bacteroidota bacterium]